MANPTIYYSDSLILPQDLRDRYKMTPDTPIRIIETRGGILLVPLMGEPASPELAAELEAWQSLSGTTLTDFPYDDARVSFLDFVQTVAPGPRPFATWEAYEHALQEEKQAWDR